MKTRLIPLGQSRGVVIPETIIAAAGIQEEVELLVHGSEIVLRQPGKHPRDGWAEAFSALGVDPNEDVMNDFVVTDFDETEWEWPETA